MTPFLFLSLISLHPLSEQISKATQKSPEYQAELQKFQAVKERTGAALYRFSPLLSAKGSNAWGATGRSNLTHSLSVGGEMTWNLFQFGADYQILNAAQEEERAAAAQLKAKELLIEETIAEAVFDALFFRRRQEVLDKLFDTRKKVHSMAARRFNSGRLSQEDFRSAEIDLKNAEAESLQSKSEAFQSRTTIERWAISLDQIDFWPDVLVETWHSKYKISEISTETLPEVVAKRAEHLRLVHLAASEWRKLAPSLDSALTGGWGRVSGDTWTKTWEGSLTLNIPIFDQWKKASEASALKRESAAAQFEVEAQIRSAQSKIRSSHENLKIFLQLLKGRKDIFKATSQTYQMKIQRFESGRLSVNDLSLELTRLLQSELLTQRSEKDLALSYTKFLHAAGKSLGDAE